MVDEFSGSGDGGVVAWASLQLAVHDEARKSAAADGHGDAELDGLHAGVVAVGLVLQPGRVLLCRAMSESCLILIKDDIDELHRLTRDREDGCVAHFGVEDVAAAEVVRNAEAVFVVREWLAQNIEVEEFLEEGAAFVVEGGENCFAVLGRRGGGVVASFGEAAEARQRECELRVETHFLKHIEEAAEVVLLLAVVLFVVPADVGAENNEGLLLGNNFYVVDDLGDVGVGGGVVLR